MKLQLLCIGKLSDAWQRDAASEYGNRLQRYFPLEIVELKEEKGGRKGDPAEIVRREGERLLEKIPERAKVILLDEKGQQFSSVELAQRIEKGMVHGDELWTLVIGGPYGLAHAVRQRADLTLSLSRLTLTHQMARIFLLEQLYRGATIIRNEPYHNR